MPIEVQLGDRVIKLPMTGGTGSITVQATAHVVIDPYDRVLKDEPAITAYQDWMKAQMAARQAGAKGTD